MRILSHFTFIFFIVTILASCSGKQYQSLFEQQAPRTDTALRQNSGDLSTYRIKPQDLLQIRNLQNVNYVVDAPTVAGGTNSNTAGGANQTYQVDEDGAVALPVIGHVTVAGLTRSQAARLIEDDYRKNLLKDPIIELKITNLKVTVLGEVTGQGNFPLVKDKTTLIEMIGQAGGLTKNANETNVKIIRQSQAAPQVTVINLRDLNAINDPRAILQNGDVIYVAQNKRSIRNENLQNITTIAQPVLLLINTALLIISFSHR